MRRQNIRGDMMALQCKIYKLDCASVGEGGLAESDVCRRAIETDANLSSRCGNAPLSFFDGNETREALLLS